MQIYVHGAQETPRVFIFQRIPVYALPICFNLFYIELLPKYKKYAILYIQSNKEDFL